MLNHEKSKFTPNKNFHVYSMQILKNKQNANINVV